MIFYNLFKILLLSISFGLSLINASPILHSRQNGDPTAASTSQINSFVTPAQYASAAYCTTLGVGSSLTGDATILYYAGDGRDVQRVYVAYSPSEGIIVAYQGTNTSSIDSIEDDIGVERVDVDSRLAFLGSGATVSKGFQNQWLILADEILSQVQNAFETYPGSELLVTGHSLGASLALLSAAYLNHNIAAASTRTVLFGLPRTGDTDFANGIDANLQNQNHIVNYRDPVPHLPGKTLGFQHPSGEVWISGDDDNNVVDCPGQENDNCSDSVHFYQYKESDHDGPYFGIEMDSNCPS